MKKRTFTSFLAAFVLAVLAVGAFAQQQVPDRFNYQAIVRDIDGNVVAEQDVTIRMTFLDGATVVSTEDFTETTNEFGLINIAADLFPAEFIGTYYADPAIKIEIDLGGGSGFVNLGENDLLSVPYAMNAGNVATLSEGVITVGSGESAVIPDATQVDENTVNISTLQGQVLTIESSIMVVEGAITNHTTRIEALENAGFITNEDEMDPVFLAHDAAGVTQTLIGNWNTAFGWGDHSQEGYLTNYIETDPVYINDPAFGITDSDVQHWTTAYGWGNHNTMGYATEIWVGNQNYLTSFTETDPVYGASPAAGITSSDVGNWTLAHSWGDHADENYLTSYTETDPVYINDPAFGITDSDVQHWTTAYDWGNHQPLINGLQVELDNTQDGAGLDADGTYPDHAKSSNYISTASSLYEADELLDQAITDANLQITNNTNNIATNSSAIATNAADIVINRGLIDVNTNNIATNSSAIAANSADIVINRGLIDINTNNIATNSSAIATNAADISDTQNELDITQLGAGLDVDGTYPDHAKSSNYISTASSLYEADELLDLAITDANLQITNNTNNIATNSSAIATNAADIVINRGLIDVNTNNIATNSSAIATNAADIVINRGLIDINTINIATNSSAIAAHGILIAQNASDISSTQAELDVTQVGAGLNVDGTYLGSSMPSNYLTTASSLNNADMLLDAQIKINDDDIAANLIQIITNADNIATNASDIASNYALIDDNSHWIFDEDKDTYITVEETADEDKIHIYQGGTEVLRIPQKGVLEVLGKSLAIGEGSGINQVNSEGKNTFVGSFAGHNTTNGINNLFIGNSAGLANTSGSNNLYIGNEAGLLNQAGSENTFIGAASGRSSQLNSGNTFIGARSGFSSSLGSNNTFIGINAGYNSANGSSNVLIGANVGYEMSSGEANTFIGNLAGYNTSTGYRNTYLGFQSGYSNESGTQNTFIGNEAGYWETGSNKLYISNDRGASLTNSRDVALIYGEFDTDILNLNAMTTVTEEMNAGESPNHTIGDAAFTVDGGAYIYKDFYVNGHSFLDQTTIDVNDGEFLIHDGDGYTTPSMNGIMADVRGYIGLVSSVESGNAQLGIQPINETQRPTAAISVNAVVGGIDIQAGDDIYMDAQTVYINGVDASKGTHMAVGIGTNAESGNIEIATAGARDITIGNAAAETLSMDASYLDVHADSDISFDSDGTMNLTSAAHMALNSSKGFTIYGAESSTIKSGDNLTIDADAILNLGTASATAINVGRAGITTNVLGALHVTEALSTASSLDVDGATTLDQVTINTTDGTFLVEGSGVMDVDVNTDISGVARISNATGATYDASAASAAGALVVHGGAYIGENLEMHGNIHARGTITSGNSITIDGTLGTHGVISESNNQIQFGTAALSAINTITTTGNITTGGYFKGVVGADADRADVFGANINGTTLTDGTAILTGGALSGISTLSATTVSSTTFTDGTATLSGGVLSGITGITCNGTITASSVDANTVSGDVVTAGALTASSATINGEFIIHRTISSSDHYWRMAINNDGNLEFQYSTDGTSWGSGTSSSVAVFIKP